MKTPVPKRAASPARRVTPVRPTTVTDTVTDDPAGATEHEGLEGDWGAVALLMVLYTLQGIPMGLTAAVSLSLQQTLPLSQQNLFQQVSWPFSLKLLWAPIVDSCYIRACGLRKTWLIPSQMAIGIAFILSSRLDLLAPENVYVTTAVFFLLFAMCATQDICVDGWALTLLSKRNVGYASTCNTIGQTLGNALSFLGWKLAEHNGVSLSEVSRHPIVLRRHRNRSMQHTTCYLQHVTCNIRGKPCAHSCLIAREAILPQPYASCFGEQPHG